MTPRRPPPARPGARPGARRPSRQAERGEQAGRGEQAPEAAAPDRRREEVPAPNHAVLRLGGADGMAVPGRALALAIVVLLAFVVVFPSLRGYLSQRAQYDAVLEEIAQAEATSTALEAELARWQDDDYVRTQARDRLSYVMPGETTYVVVGADEVERAEQAAQDAQATEERPWYEVLRESARVAGGEEAEQVVVDPAQQGWTTTTPTPTPGATSVPTAGSSTAATEATP
ncbi:MAG: septum formation initiator family protein [Actinomyces sp.]|uniref:FtsB family cell division protein n=1 Tax=Actinomyces sp. TaxID=29317 RepID=UPI0026DAC789|nr:septum formation initiator family protein [Actinomyces sp.]MDO4243207.1 septum formation initiator family protein [Actinomyces sp.]